MRVKGLRLQNFKAFEDTGQLELGELNLFVGHNNSGKSTLVRALGCAQVGVVTDLRNYVRLGSPAGDVLLTVEDPVPAWSNVTDTDSVQIRVGANQPSIGQIIVHKADGQSIGAQQIPHARPGAFVIPLLSGRKPIAFQESVNAGNRTNVGNDLSQLASRMSGWVESGTPTAQAYRNACESILGFIVTTVPTDNGQVPGIFISDDVQLPITALGDGVTHLAGFLIELATASGKLFLIEEPENDLHPTALRQILELIRLSAEQNQFAITTHSNIVLRELGSLEECRVFHVKSVSKIPPLSTCTLVGSDPSARLEILADLGYEARDLEFFDGWLILEESSAERVIRDVLIPHFVPGLTGRMGTVAAGGNTRVRPTFDDFYRLFLYAHLQPQYKDRAWVIVDGDTDGEEIVGELRRDYATWDSSSFRTWTRPHFEAYYPQHFSDRVAEVLSLPHDERRSAKRQLLLDVLRWTAQNRDAAKEEWETSASDVIAVLQEIADKL
jgi:hypothetical protein